MNKPALGKPVMMVQMSGVMGGGKASTAPQVENEEVEAPFADVVPYYSKAAQVTNSPAQQAENEDDELPYADVVPYFAQKKK
jgi:hypothetical protein